MAEDPKNSERYKNLFRKLNPNGVSPQEAAQKFDQKGGPGADLARKRNEAIKNAGDNIKIRGFLTFKSTFQTTDRNPYQLMVILDDGDANQTLFASKNPIRLPASLIKADGFDMWKREVAVIYDAASGSLRQIHGVGLEFTTSSPAAFDELIIPLSQRPADDASEDEKAAYQLGYEKKKELLESRNANFLGMMAISQPKVAATSPAVEIFFYDEAEKIVVAQGVRRINLPGALLESSVADMLNKIRTENPDNGDLIYPFSVRVMERDETEKAFGATEKPVRKDKTQKTAA